MIKFIKRWRNWWCAVIALVVTLGFALSYTPGLFLALRSPTERETVLYYFAQNIGLLRAEYRRAGALWADFLGGPSELQRPVWWRRRIGLAVRLL